MVKRIGSLRHKTRHKFKKNIRQKGKLSLSRYFQVFNEGDKVCLTVEPSVQNGIYCPRFVGKSGLVMKKNGTCYEVAIKDHNKAKTLIVHPVHLKRL
ncbi:MAG: 50S ribosomal protein L21e [Nanoarchaeota archaeon]|nr:50S ribosomal protein L21e [Nanoarchaeota archaeon]